MKRFRKQLNFRDLGGYPTKDGRKVPYGKFYRSGGIYLYNEEERAVFKTLGIDTIFDLRTSEEIESKPNPSFEGIRYIQFSGIMSELGKEIDFSPNGMRRIGEEGHEQYRLLWNYFTQMPYKNEAIQLFFQQIKEDHVPIVFHCASGKDRTGIIAMLLLLLLGVDEEVVFEDYMLSNEYLKENIEKELEDKKEHIQKHPEAEELLTMMEGVSPNIGRGVLNTLHESYASIEEYFLIEHGFTEDMIQEIRNRYLID